MTRLISTLIFLLLFGSAYAQQQHAELVQDEKVGLLIDKYKILNRHQSTLSGWRIQIFFDSGVNSKHKATSVLKRFSELYPQTQAYLSFKEPYYRVRVGDFRSRLEAEGFLKKIQIDYPNAFPASDFINPPPID
ncbi:MAG: SPOR domain-containing protein [Lentimicrobiaceae bacterium]